ncbi:MAG TPA: DNA translocase FtsK, partial [Thermodesulfobacteriota bacterium]|nr:DNA translocase FtsK [Thermodesulfobacteriota bacterium]
GDDGAGRGRPPREDAGGAGFVLPPLTFLDPPAASGRPAASREELLGNARLLERKLAEFGVEGRVTEVHPGPVITMYEFEPAPGVKVNRIVNLADDLALALKALSVRIVAPLPHKAAVGIEVPNAVREQVVLREILATDPFRRSASPLTFGLGKDIGGAPVVVDLARMPHLLVAGATGSGKSMSLNAMIVSLLYKATPDEVRLLMVDPKMLELNVYDGIPHLLLPVVTEPKKAAAALRWGVTEMERRYRLLAEAGVRNIDQYNRELAEAQAAGRPFPPRRGAAPDGGEEPGPPERLPYLVIVVDELADLMFAIGREIEESIARLAQKARAAGIHLLVATQRPSVDVITGLIKANFPARIAFQVASKVDSRTILDTNGAEHLLGQGDMLFLPPWTSKLQRIHGAYVGEAEIRRIVDFLKAQAEPEYDESILEGADDDEGDPVDDGEVDPKYDEAVRIVCEARVASTSLIQRRLRIGYNRAARMIERMEREGIVGPGDGSKPREVLAGRIGRLGPDRP